MGIMIETVSDRRIGNMNWEFTVLDAISSIHTHWLDSFFQTITHLGDAGWFWIFLALILLIFQKTRLCGICMLVSMLVGALITNAGLKPLVARERPCWIRDPVQLLIDMPKDYSFPSGHTQVSFVSAMAIFQNNRKWGIAAFVLASLIAFSRLYLYVHFPTDVLAGIVIGMAVGRIMSCMVRKKYKIKRV